MAKIAVKRRISHADYVSVLRTGESTRAEAVTIRSTLHQIYSMRVRKRALDAADTKRVVLSNGVDTLPYGHYHLEDSAWCDDNLLMPRQADSEDDDDDDDGGSE